MKTAQAHTAPTRAIDEKGYLTQPEDWTPELAAKLAHEEVPEGLEEDHWKVILYIRQYYLELGTVPPVRKLSRETGFTLREMKRMFPSGLARGACIIAGIPSDAIKPSFLYP